MYGQGGQYCRRISPCCSKRTIGSKVRLGMYSTRLETHGCYLFDCADWMRPVGDSLMEMILRPRFGLDCFGQGFGLRFEWDDFVVSDWHSCDA